MKMIGSTMITDSLILNQHERIDGVTKTMFCRCGKIMNISSAYRCLYCEEFFCLECAEKHFGKTKQEHVIEKRVEMRNQAKQQIEDYPKEAQKLAKRAKAILEKLPKE